MYYTSGYTKVSGIYIFSDSLQFQLFGGFFLCAINRNFAFYKEKQVWSNYSLYE